MKLFFHSPLGKETAHLKEKISSSTHGKAPSTFDEAFSQLCDPLLPVRGHAMIQLALLIRQRDPKAVQATDTLLKIFLEQLTHDDSYIYLAAIQGLVSLADERADIVMPRLACEFAMCQKEAGNFAVRTKNVNEKGYYKPREGGWFGVKCFLDENIDLEPTCVCGPISHSMLTYYNLLLRSPSHPQL